MFDTARELVILIVYRRVSYVGDMDTTKKGGRTVDLDATGGGPYCRFNGGPGNCPAEQGKAQLDNRIGTPLKLKLPRPLAGARERAGQQPQIKASSGPWDANDSYTYRLTIRQARGQSKTSRQNKPQKLARPYKHTRESRVNSFLTTQS